MRTRGPSVRASWAAWCAALVTAPVLIGLLGHGLREVADPGHAHAKHGVVGLCLLVVAALGSLALARSGDAPGPVRTRTLWTSVEPAFQVRAHAPRLSPAWLQRFRN